MKLSKFLAVPAVTFLFFVFLSGSAYASFSYSYDSSPPSADQVADSFCAGSIQTCWNSSSVGVTDCGTACTGGNAWEKHVYSGCYYVAFLGYKAWLPFASATCSTGDKCTSSWPYLNAGYCDCSVGGIYKTCCDTTTGRADGACVAYAVDTTNPPWEGYCPAGTATEFCGFGGYPACGDAACAKYAPPPDCNTGVSCSGACSAPANTCSTNNGTQTSCVYTAYSGGGSCTQTTAPNQQCTVNNCSAGYTCQSGICTAGPNPPTAAINGPTSITLGQSGSFTATANQDSTSSLASGEIYWSPTGSQSWTLLNPVAALSGSTGSFSRTWTPTATGTYYVVVNAYNVNGQQCTGNPFGIDPGWVNCGSNDAVTVTVTTVAATPTPTPTPASSCNAACIASGYYYGICQGACGGNYDGSPSQYECASNIGAPLCCCSRVPATPTPTPTGAPTPTPTRAPSTYDISGTVWVDTNGNGFKDILEDGFQSARITITGGAFRNTDNSGFYLFSSLASGTYTITLTVPSGYILTTSNPVTRTLPNNATANFGIQPLSTISGTVFVDTNGSGAKDTGEPGYSGATLTGPGGETDTTGASGSYGFPGLASGTYTITLTVPSGYILTTSNPVTRTLPPDATANFGIRFNKPDLVVSNLSVQSVAAGPITPRDGSSFDTNGGSGASWSNPTYAQTSNSQRASVSLDGNPSSRYLKAQGFGFNILPGSTINGILVEVERRAEEEGWGGNPRIVDDVIRLVKADGTIGGSNRAGSSYWPESDAYTSYGSGTYLWGLTWTPADINNSNFGVAVSARNEGDDAIAYIDHIRITVYLASEAGESLEAVFTLKNNSSITTPPGVNFRIDLWPDRTSSPNLGELSDCTPTPCKIDQTEMAANEQRSVTIPFTAPLTAGTKTVQILADSPDVIDEMEELTNNRISKIYFVTAPPTYTISGNVFVDADKNRLKNGGETNYTGAITISSTEGTVSAPSGTGVYTVDGLIEGTYTISYTDLPSGYQLTYPLNGPPPSFTVTVGASCSVGGSNSATCGGGSISNLNFGITNSNPWIQSTCTDIRFDTGFDDPIPITADPVLCGGPNASINASISVVCTTPGIIMSGDSSYSFGQGQASSTNWVVGGTTYPEVFAPTRGGGFATSYAYVLSVIKQAGLTPTDLSTVCTLSNCTLPAGFSHGLYKANSDLYLNAFTFLASSNYVILVNGNLYIRGKILVPNGSTATFIVSGNIYVDQTVGEAVISSTTPDIEGFYSTDKSFIIQGTNDCMVGADLRLNVAGTIVVNAGLTGGSFQNLRDLCGGNLSCPVFSISERPDFILNAPEVIKRQNAIYQEVAP